MKDFLKKLEKLNKELTELNKAIKTHPAFLNPYEIEAEIKNSKNNHGRQNR